MQELNITSPNVDSKVDYNTFNMGNPMPESTLSPSQGQRIWPLLNKVVGVGGVPLNDSYIFRSAEGSTVFCVAPTRVQGRRHTRLPGRGWDDPIPKKGTDPWYSVYYNPSEPQRDYTEVAPAECLN
jgi:hypothetical protein